MGGVVQTITLKRSENKTWHGSSKIIVLYPARSGLIDQGEDELLKAIYKYPKLT